VLKTLEEVQSTSIAPRPREAGVAGRPDVLADARRSEQAAKNASISRVPSAPGRTDATPEQTEVESFAVLGTPG